MKFLTRAMLIAMATGSLALPVVANAATAEVVWKNPEKYTDVRPTNESRVKFRERTFKALEEYITELAEELPEGDKLTMTVTNLDLAGQVWPASFAFGNATGSDIRVIKRVDIPRISFSYSLTDSNGEVLKSAEVKLKDMAFLNTPTPFIGRENLGYEKNMLKEWFEDDLIDSLAKN